MRVIKTRYLTKTIEIHRGWRERLWTRPWRPWRAYDFIQVASDEVFLMNENTIIMNPNHPKAHQYLELLASELSPWDTSTLSILADIQAAKQEFKKYCGVPSINIVDSEHPVDIAREIVKNTYPDMGIDEESFKRTKEAMDKFYQPRCGGSGMVLYEPGPNQAGEMCPGCPECQPEENDG